MSVINPQKPLVLTPNERLSLSLREAHDQERIAAGDFVWETLASCSWSTFLSALWEERALGHRGRGRLPTILNPWQERFLWMRVLEQSEQGGLLLNLGAAGRLAKEAWSIVKAYGLGPELEQPAAPWDEETQVFLGWASAFEEICERENWLDRSRLETAISQAIVDGEIPLENLPSQLTFVGFTDLTPAQSHLIGALAESGISSEHRATPEHNNVGGWCQTLAEDAESELRNAARWIRHLLEQTRKGRPPRIGLVVSDLQAQRSTVTRVLDEILQPGHLLPHNEGDDSLYNLSLGRPLAAWPVVADAMSLLNLSGRPQPLVDLGVLFHSPFLGEAETERGNRALLESRLLRDGAYEVTLMGVARRATATPSRGGEDQEYPHTCRALGERLKKVVEDFQDTPSRQAPSRWATQFRDTLDMFGWPGERPLDSGEYQTVQRFHETLAHLGTLDRIAPALSRNEAVSHLRRISEETVYQPRIANGPVEVLGYLEAAGLPFDHLWIVGMHDGAWPQPSRPNPYLPTSLQSAHGVPHSSAERELEFARRLTRQLLGSAPHGVVSSPSHDKDQELRPSLLVAHLPVRSLGALPLSTVESLADRIFESRNIERARDPGPPAVSDDHHSRGGTGLFKQQSACPFRAFATYRLRARPLDLVEAGLGPQERGSVLHIALESLWDGIKSLKTWQTRDAQERAATVEAAVEVALLALKRKRPDALSGVYLELERERLRRLLFEWMEVEEERSPFIVRDTERSVEFEFGGVKLSAVIDRIDQLEDGSLVLLDYKTGNVKVGDWLDERPADPQLPLYCVAGVEEFSGLAFARIKTGDMKFVGIADQDDLIPGLRHSEQAGDLGMTWSQRQAQWRDTLLRIAQEYRSGKFDVDPAKGRATCQYCGLETLCRIDEQEAGS